MKLYELTTGHFQGNSSNQYFLATEKEPTSDEIREILAHIESRHGRQNPQKIAVRFSSGITSGDESCTRYAVLSLEEDSVDETRLDDLAKEHKGKMLRF